MLQWYKYIFDTEITVHNKPWKQIEALDWTSVLFCTSSEADRLALNEQKNTCLFSKHNSTGHIKHVLCCETSPGLLVLSEPQHTYTTRVTATIWKIILLLNVQLEKNQTPSVIK